MKTPPSGPSHPELDHLIRLISNVMDSFTTALLLLEPEDQLLHLKAYHSLSKGIHPQATIASGDGLVGWVAKNARPLHVTQFDRDTRMLGFYRIDEEIKSFLAVPVGPEDGVLCVDSKQKWVFTEKSQKILQDFALLIHQMLPLLTVRESEEEIRAGADFQQELDRIYLGVEKRTAFIEEALNCLRTYAEAPAGFLCLWDEPGKNYRIILAQGQVPVTSMKGPFYPEMGLAGWVMRENRPLFLNRILPNADKTYLFSPDDPYVGFQSFVGIPVTFRDQVLGAVCLTFSHPSEWSQRFLEAIKGVGPKIGAGLTLRTHFA